MNPDQTTNSAGGAAAVLRRRWKILLAILVIVVGVTTYHQVTKSKQYKATSDVTFDSSSLPQSVLAAASQPNDPTVDGPTNVLIATSLEVARAVKTQLHVPVPAAELAGEVSAQVAPNAAVIQITATAATPTEAAQLSNAFATQYINFKTASQVAAINRAQTDLEKQLAALPATSTQRGALEGAIRQLGQARAVADGGSQIISPATAPSKPAGTSTPIVVLIGALIGLALGFLVVYLLEVFDRRMGSADLIEAEYRLPLLATIPEGLAGETAESRVNQLEPIRMLRTSIDLTSTRSIKTLLVTSAGAGEGKTTVAVDLAHAAARTGREVTLVELDLRRPTFGRHFSIDPRRGFTSVLLGGESLADMVVQPLADVPSLRVLPSGPLPPNPADLIESRETAQIIKDLSADGRLVIIDSPPLNPVADAQVLLSSPAIDAAIVVAHRGVSTRDGVRRARRILDRHLLQPLGVVVNGTSDAAQYGYGYTGEQFPGGTASGLDAAELSHANGRPRGASGPRSASPFGAKDSRQDQRSRARRAKAQSRKPGN